MSEFLFLFKQTDNHSECPPEQHNGVHQQQNEVKMETKQQKAETEVNQKRKRDSSASNDNQNFSKRSKRLASEDKEQTIEDTSINGVKEEVKDKHEDTNENSNITGTRNSKELFHIDFKKGSIIACRPDPASGDKFWLASVLKTRKSGQGLDVSVQWFEKDPKKMWHYVSGSKQRLPVATIFHHDVTHLLKKVRPNLWKLTDNPILYMQDDRSYS